MFMQWVLKTTIKTQRKFSPFWQYSTNKPSGNIKGGGTTKYEDYEPFYNPSQKRIVNK